MLREGLLTKYIHIAAVVACYWIISILTVFVNKALLSSQTVSLDAPLFVTWCQCVVSATICFTLSMLTKLFPHIFTFPEGSPFNYEVAAKVLPLSVLFTGTIAFNNLSLKYVDVAFYYIGRSLTTVFNVILTYLILGQKTSFQTITCCAVIVGGFWLGVDQESVAGSLSIIGTIFGVLGSLALSMYSIYTKQVLPYVNQHVLLLSYYNNVYSCLLFVPLIVINKEVPVILNYEKLVDFKFWLLMTGGGLCGFAIGFVTALQIQVTSPLTHNISGTAKACVQTVLATYWFNETKSLLWWFSNWVVLGGSAAYARVRQKEMEHQQKSDKSQRDQTPPDRPHHQLWRVLEHIQQEIAHHTLTCTPGDTGICVITNTCSKIEALPPGTSQNETEYNATCSWLRYDEGIHHDTSLHSVMTKPSSLKVWGLGLCSVAVISLSGLFGGLFWPLINSNFYNQMMRILIGLAVGSLSATSTFQLIPEGFQIKDDGRYLNTAVFMWGSLWVFYIFEVLSKILLHKRHNDQPEQLPIHRLPKSEERQSEEGLLSSYTTDRTSVTKPAIDTNNREHPTSKTTVAYMIIFGDALHNFIDGMSIGAGYSKDLSAGLGISIAVACEEFPHELGDFAILINSGMPVKKALMYNFLSACTAFGGLTLGIIMGDLETSAYVFAFAGGLFLYVSLADLMPELNRMVEEELVNSKISALVVLLLQNGGIFIGVSTLFLVTKYPVAIS